LTGTGIPEGPTAYVMTEEGNANWIWNANTGEYYTVYDNFCPLITVGCIINTLNYLLIANFASGSIINY